MSTSNESPTSGPGTAEPTVDAGGVDVPPADRVGLDLPADPRHAATARVVVASVAADAGFSIDEIDDLRLALNEAVALLVDDETISPGDDRVEVQLRTGPGRITIDVRRPGLTAAPGIDDLSGRILDAVVDEHVVGPGSVRLVKVAVDADASLDPTAGTRPGR